MLSRYVHFYRTLCFALLAMLCLCRVAQAADYTANIETSGSNVTLWFKSNVNTSWVNAHYQVNNGAQQNVPMTLNSAKARFETTFAASLGQTVNFAFTYDNGGPAFDSPWASSVVQDANKVAAPSFSLPGGNYTAPQSVTVSSTTAGATLLCSINGGAQSACPNPISINSNTTISAVATKSGMQNSDATSVSYTIGQVTGPYTQGVQDNGSSATIWFAPNPSAGWVDIHYNVNSTGQQNVRMNAANGRYEQVISGSAAMSLSYSFTYMSASGAVDTPVFTWVRGGKVATPSVSPAPGTYATAQTLSFTSSTSGAAFCVTLNGSTPVKNVNCVAGAIVVSAANTTVKAIAYKTGMQDSDVLTAQYQIQCCAATPVISPNGGNFNMPQSVSISSSTPNATIYYTLDGSQPTSNALRYNGPFTLNAPGATVRALAVASGLASSSVASAQFTILASSVGTPSFTPPAGTYASAQTVRLASSTPGASIFYRLNNGAEQLYSDASPLQVSSNSSISAVARKSGMVDSTSVSASYTISSCTTCFAYGVVEDGATARVWFAPSWSGGSSLSTAIAHYRVTSASGAQSPQRDENMLYNATLKRWQAPLISPVAAGDKIDYFFTYSAATGGNMDSPLYHYVVCGDSSTCVDPVGKPLFSVPSGKYSSAQSVALSLPSGVASDAKIYYTLDGSVPNINSTLYVTGHPILVSSAVTITAITVLPNQLQSGRASASYDIVAACSLAANCSVAAPSFSHASGTYSTVIGVNLLTTTPGATIHYTLDGSTPTATSPQFYGAIWMRNTALGATTTLKALATKNGVNSAVVERTYTISANGESAWNGMTTFNIVNGTKGKYSDDQVYWIIIGKDWISHQYVHVDKNGALVPMSLGDNTIPVPGRTTGYANYAISLAQAKSVTIPAIESARIYMSVGKPVLIQVNTNDLGQLAYAGPDLNNSTDPNLDVTFDFGEFNINRARPFSDMPGIFVNTSRVDIFGFPLQLNVTGLDGYNATVGESLLETRDELFARFNLEVPEQFKSLAQAPYAPYRIMSPAHGTFDDGLDVHTGAQQRPRGANSAYLDAYISQVWDQYRNQDLVLNLQNGWPTFTGRVGFDNTLTFTDGMGSYKIYGKPSTTEVMLGNGVLDDARGTDGNKLAHDKQLQLQAQVCAALNRHVADLPFAQWWNGASFYPANQAANYFTKFWHEHSLNGLAYGFSYDDVGGHSPSIYTPSPVAVTFTIGK
ncbi:MAG: chitobiase/beta-hexosaminidase C-terminal domain-containing protein [Burkholderiales bacterium]|nr:chitobiase/beta-hexosaminidase C-terminal domain-containing protein [Burkholderiales bacterium]